MWGKRGEKPPWIFCSASDVVGQNKSLEHPPGWQPLNCCHDDSQNVVSHLEGGVRQMQISSHLKGGGPFYIMLRKDNLRHIPRLFPSQRPLCLLFTKCARLVFVPGRLAVSKAQCSAYLPLDLHQFTQAGGHHRTAMALWILNGRTDAFLSNTCTFFPLLPD